jgi:glycosyltransferase involved in cell wall biosynthesis
MLPRLAGVGGMVSFQEKLAVGLSGRSVGVCYSLSGGPYRSVLVIGGTRQLAGLWRVKRRGVRIIQRLDGMNWMQRVLPTGTRHRMRAEYGNFLLAFIRARLADAIVYQSEFAKDWWEREYGRAKVPSRVIHNGVDLKKFTPQGGDERPTDSFRLLLVEGSLMGGYELGLGNALGLASGLVKTKLVSHSLFQKVELVVAGRVSSRQRALWDQRLEEKGQDNRVSLTWAGLVPHECIPELDRSAHLLYSADLNPACPNSVIEALACGTPVIAFDTGALSELVTEDAGRIVPYGGDPWLLEQPDVPALVDGASEILQDLQHYQAGARARAEEAFSLEEMVDRYLQVLLDE